ncbi:MAG: hypothetical protein ACLUFV_01455 [Acutalibacteraceae bacterium]
MVVSRANPRAARYLELPFDCDLTCYGNGIVASVAEPLVEPVRGYIERFPPSTALKRRTCWCWRKRWRRSACASALWRRITCPCPTSARCPAR